MRRFTRSIVLLLAAFAPPSAASAQLPSSRPDAETIVAALAPDGLLAGWSAYADFVGCPQEDETGRQALDLISSTGTDERATATLVRLWMDEFQACAYAPLDDWMLRSFADLARAGSTWLTFALMDLPMPSSSELSNRLRALASDASVPASARAELGTEVLVRLGGSDRRDAYLGILATPGLPAEWIARWSADVVQEMGGAYVRALGAAAPSLDDETLHAAIGTILTYIGTPRLPSDDPALAALADAIRGRAGLEGSLRFVEALSRPALPTPLN